MRWGAVFDKGAIYMNITKEVLLKGGEACQ